MVMSVPLPEEDPTPVSDDAPLESDPADWQEQQLEVPIADADERR